MADDDPPDDARAALEAARAGAEHWRHQAEHRAAELAALKRRPAVRLAVALDRRAAGPRTALRAGRQRLGEGLARAGMAAAALPQRRRLADRRRPIDDAALLPPPPLASPTVTLVLVGAGAAPLAATPSAAVVDVVQISSAGAVVPAVRSALAGAASSHVAIVSGSIEPVDDRWLDRLVEVLDEPVVAATPLVVHPARPLRSATPLDLRVRAAGVAVDVDGDGVPGARPGRAGDEPRPDERPHLVDAVTATCVVLDRQACIDAGGLDDLGDVDAAVMDLALRLRWRGGRLACVPGAVVLDRRPATWSELRRRTDRETPGWREVVDRHGPALVRAQRSPGAPPHLRIALTVAAPSAKVAPRWGDWHFAEAAAAALRRRGCEVRLQTAADADHPAGRSCDVHVVLRGLHPVRPTPGQRQVLWVVSHPEALDAEECDAADLVAVASHRFAAALRPRTVTPVEVLLQATDHRRFRPCAPVAEHRHDVTVVAKSRDVLRPMVADALAAGVRPAIYGSGWDGLVDPALVVADHVPNAELPVVYSSAGIVLNDHWATMRAWGFVSNRVFDVVACGAALATDHLPEIAELFGGLVPTWRTPDELRDVVRAALDDPEGARQRAAAARRVVLAAHTFDVRAGELLAALAAHGLVDDEDLPLRQRPVAPREGPET